MPRAISKRIRTPRAKKHSLPAAVMPMLAVASNLPDDSDNYSFEWKWDGVRALCCCDVASLRLFGRQGNDISERYPELRYLRSAIGKHSVVLDGEIIALDDAGMPSFARLQRRMHVVDLDLVAQLTSQVPVWYVIFDLLHLDGRSLIETPYHARRKMLEQLLSPGAHWLVTSTHVGDGVAMLDAARRTGLEGIVAKRLDGNYETGRRSTSWLKIKVVQRQEFVVGGWIPEARTRLDRVGALLIGYYDDSGKLRYAGRLGSGFSGSEHALLVPLLDRASRSANPFSDIVPSAGVKFTKPSIVVEVEYRRWPTDGLVQQAAYKGIRRDKSPRQVVKEQAVETESIR